MNLRRPQHLRPKALDFYSEAHAILVLNTSLPSPPTSCGQLSKIEFLHLTPISQTL